MAPRPVRTFRSRLKATTVFVQIECNTRLHKLSTSTADWCDSSGRGTFGSSDAAMTSTYRRFAARNPLEGYELNPEDQRNSQAIPFLKPNPEFEAGM